MGFNGDLYPSAGASVVMTTKGDIARYNTERERYGIGSTGQVLQVASSLPTWATLTTADSVLTTQGDVLYEGASGLARLGFGTTGDVLTTKGTGANPVWETPSGGASFNLQTVQMGSSFSTSSTSFVLVTDMSTELTKTEGKFLASMLGSHYANADGHYAGMELTLDGTQMEHEQRFGTAPANVYKTHCVQFWGTSSVVDVDFNIYIGNGSYIVSILATHGSLDIMEIF